MRMPEPVSSTAAGAVSAKILGALGVAGTTGVIGALMVSAFDEPKSKREWFIRSLVAGIASLFFGAPVVKVLDHYSDWIDLTNMPFVEAMQYAAPVYLVIGCLSWGAFGALASLNRIIKKRGAQALARRIPGLEDEDQSE